MDNTGRSWRKWRLGEIARAWVRVRQHYDGSIQAKVNAYLARGEFEDEMPVDLIRLHEIVLQEEER